MTIEMDDLLRGLREKRERHEKTLAVWEGVKDKTQRTREEIGGWKSRLLELDEIIEWCERWE